MNRQILYLPMHAVWPGNALLFKARQTAATHHVGADDFGQQRLHGQGVDCVFSLSPRGVSARHFMHRQHLGGTCGKLDFHHREQGAAGAVHHVVSQRVVKRG